MTSIGGWEMFVVCGFTTEFNFEERVPSLTYPINNIARCIKCSREFFFFFCENAKCVCISFIHFYINIRCLYSWIKNYILIIFHSAKIHCSTQTLYEYDQRIIKMNAIFWSKTYKSIFNKSLIILFIS